MVAHEAFGRLLQRLIVPRIVCAVPERVVDDVPPGLGLAHLGVVACKVPARLGLGLQLGPGALMRRGFGKVRQLVRISLKVKELVGIRRAHRVFPLSVAQADHRRD